MKFFQTDFNDNLFFFRLVVPTFSLLLLFANGNLTAQSTKEDQQQTQQEKGEITLSIGDGFVFGEADARPDKDRSKLDVYVQDIRYGVSLAALAGCTVPAQPMTSAGLPKVPSKLMELLKDAPLDLPKRDLWLLPECTSRRPGIGIVKSRSGVVYKLCLLKINGHPEALRRTVRIAYESVPTAAGGGVLQLPAAKGQPDAATTASIREALRIGMSIPGDSFARDMDGDYVTFEKLVDGAVLESDAQIALTTELDTAVKMENRGALFASKGIGEKGSILLDAYGAIGVKGPMKGRIDLGSYGYIFVDGPMEGTLNLDSYSTVVLKQGMSGTLRMRSYTDLLVQGPITGTIDANGSCWSTCYFDGEYSNAELVKMSPVRGRGDFQQITLHIEKSSDLADGEHEGIGTWRKVIVGDPIWKKFEETEKDGDRD